jgi:hypothetical protein
MKDEKGLIKNKKGSKGKTQELVLKKKKKKKKKKSRWGRDFLQPSRPALGPTQPLIH